MGVEDHFDDRVKEILASGDWVTQDGEVVPPEVGPETALPVAPPDIDELADYFEAQQEELDEQESDTAAVAEEELPLAPVEKLFLKIMNDIDESKNRYKSRQPKVRYLGSWIPLSAYFDVIRKDLRIGGVTMEELSAVRTMVQNEIRTRKAQSTMGSRAVTRAATGPGSVRAFDPSELRAGLQKESERDMDIDLSP